MMKRENPAGFPALRKAPSHWLLVATLAVVTLLTGCGNGSGTTPRQDAGPQFVINSPLEGSTTAGTFYFSVQPLDPAEISSIRFLVGGQDLGTLTSESRLVIRAREHAAGPLEFTAEASGRNGAKSSRTVRVNNIPSPPDSANVGSSGAALGALEQDGSLSTLVVPPGGSTGGTVSLATRTEAEVLAGTGVSYTNLGLTFLGAQEITTSAGLVRPFGLTSGGFERFIVDGQAVVQYMILPDQDGDGIGEIVIANGASAAGADVISDPVPLVQVGAEATVSSQGLTTLSSVASGLTGPPGTAVTLDASGFNSSSLFGNVAEFRGRDHTIELPGSVITLPSGKQVFRTVIPPVGTGNATLTLHNVGTGYSSETLNVSVQALPAATAAPAEQVEAALAALLGFMARLDALDPPVDPGDSFTSLGSGFASSVRADVARLLGAGTVEADNALAVMGGMLQVGGVATRFEAMAAELSGASFATLQADCNPILDQATEGMDMITNVGRIPYLFTPTDVIGGEFPGQMVSAGWAKLKNAALEIDRALGGNACRPDEPDSPGPLQDFQQGSGTATTGMGAAPVSGGSLAGSVGDSSSLGNRQRPGRFVIKVTSPTRTNQFSGATDAGGYFKIPLVPQGEPIEITVIDTDTGERVTRDGTGPAVGEAEFWYFDFSNRSSGPADTISWTGAGDASSWEDPLNWDHVRLPRATDHVVIAQPTASVRLSTSGFADVEIQQLTVGGSLTVRNYSNTLRIIGKTTIIGALTLEWAGLELWNELLVTESGRIDWQGGNVSAGPSGNGVIVNRGLITASSGGSVSNLWLGLHNEGTLQISGSGEAIRAGRGAVIRNAAGATLDFAGDAHMGHGGDPVATIENYGLVTKSSGSGPSSPYVIFDNPGGRVSIQAGTLQLLHGGAWTGGAFDLAAGTALELGRGTAVTTLAGTNTGSGTGTLSFTGGSLVVSPDGATLDSNDVLVRWSRSTISGGHLTNNGRFEIVANSFETGTLDTWLINNGSMSIVAGSNPPVNALSVRQTSGITNNGDIIVAGNFNIAQSGSSGAIMINNGTISKTVVPPAAEFAMCLDPASEGSINPPDAVTFRHGHCAAP